MGSEVGDQQGTVVPLNEYGEHSYGSQSVEEYQLADTEEQGASLVPADLCMGQSSVDNNFGALYGSLQSMATPVLSSGHFNAETEAEAGPSLMGELMGSNVPATSALLSVVMAQPPLNSFQPVAPSGLSSAGPAVPTPLLLGEERGSSAGAARTGKGKRKRRLKRVEVDLEPAAYEKLMKLVNEKHCGSVERFLMAVLASTSLAEKAGRKTGGSSSSIAPRKPALTKWKRIKYDQLRGSDAQELAMAYSSLASSSGATQQQQQQQQQQETELCGSLADVPWEELTVVHMEKMLEETKRMLLVSEKVHDCPQPGCGRRFSTPGNLRDHLNEHSGERPYACSLEGCGMHFPSKQLLCRHMKKHERAHACPYDGCGKRFAFRERLVVHQKIHSDERPLTCPWDGCVKTFKWANSLHGHMRTHTREKPFHCSVGGCGRLFGYKVDLTRHMRTHYGQPARLTH
eukprot:jgi/Mesen1/4603/ME000233S03898